MKPLDLHANFPVRKTLNGAFTGLLLAVALAVVSPVAAVEVSGLYRGTVTVDSRADERERQRAFSTALRQVLLKVTGNDAIYSQPLIRRALANADDYVDTWSYGTVANTAGNGDSAPGIELNVTFFEPEVRRLLEASNVPLWPRNRPYTLVWLVVQDELGDRQLVGSNTRGYQDVLDMLESAAQARGLPVLLPILDFEDLREVSARDVWEMATDRVLAASSRYQSESVLVMRLFRTLAGDVLGRSNYLFRNQVLERESFEESAETFITQSIGLAADELSAYYAIRLSGTDSNMEVNLTVEGIASAEDYAGLLNYVGQLTDVNAYQLTAVNNQTIQLTLATGGQLRQLVETIALNRNLLPTGDLVREDNQVFMSYRWNR